MESSEDDFKWFGEGFVGFPKKLPDDTVEYAILVINSRLSEAQIISSLRSFLTEANATIKKLLKDYIWQRESFKLELKHDDDVWALRGRVNFGDSIADEWLIVYLLREMSRKNPDAWIRVYDTDGEFLLIESANVLPAWLKPEITLNRIWINNGQLRIVPKDDQGEPKALTIQEAISIISANPSKLIHSPLIEDEAFYRIRNYPAEISDNFHHSKVTIPRKLAYVLHHNPAYISSAIESFYLRDPIAIKPLRSANPKDLSFAPTDLVDASVKFTKVGFAQLRSQDFAVPPTWKDVIPDNDMPSKEATMAEMGMKLTCGFEMLVSDPQKQDKKAVREISILVEDIDSGEEQLPTDKEIEAWGARDDSESWLDINFQDFEAELAGKGKKSLDSPAGFGDKTAQENLRKMVQRFEDFLNDEDAGLEGAELDEDDDDDDDDSDDEDPSDNDSGEDREVSFDENEFARMMREMMGMPPEEDTESGVSAKDASNSIVQAQSKSTSRQEEDGDDGEEVRKVMERMEAELEETGVLNLDPTPKKIIAARSGSKGKEKALEHNTESQGEDEGGDLDIDYNLVRNIVESFNAQGGAAGPSGNLMALMGVRFPPDKTG